MDWLSVLDLESGAPKQRALTDAIIRAVEMGDLRDGERLPTHRELAQRLGVSVQTVSAGYQEAQRRGFIRSVVGRGSFASTRRAEQAGGFMLGRGAQEGIDLSLVRATYTEVHERAARRLMGELAERDNSAWMSPPRPVAGFDRHREVGCAWLARLGVSASPDRILVTNGATHAMFVALATVTQPGDLVLTEQLTENGLIGAASLLGLTMRGVATDEQGILPEALDKACRAEPVAALVWVPTLGNPTSHLATTERRVRIAEVARRHGVPVIEDEVFRALLENPGPSIVDLLPEQGFLATSFTKSVMTGLRVGYLVAPQAYALRAASVMRVTTWSSSPVAAEMATHAVENGMAWELVSLQRNEAAARQMLLQDILGPYVLGTHPASLCAWLRVPEGWSEESLVAVLRTHRVSVASSAPFAVGPGSMASGIRVCLGGPFCRGALQQGLKILRDILGQRPSIDPQLV